jgi:septum formation protein
VKPLVLASRSPQRSAILERLGVQFEVRPADVVEIETGDPRAAALENALRKARAARAAGAAHAADVAHAAGASGVADVARAAGASGAADAVRAAGASDAADFTNAAGEVRGFGAGELVLGVDTVVELGGRIYGKPPDEHAARRTLAVLSGRTHAVLSGLALLDGRQERTAVAATRVRFRPLGAHLIDWYIATGEWRERAGGYAIQGAGAALVHEIQGDYENVVGLPVATLLDLCPELL